MFKALKHRPYRNLFTGELISDTIDWLDFTALTVLIVYNWGLGPGALAAFLIAFEIPWVVIGPLISVYADRWPAKTTLIVCTLLRAVVIVGFLFAPNLFWLLPLVFLKASTGTLFLPTRMGAIRSLVPKDLMPDAISLSQLSSFGTKVIAPAIGGSIIAFSSVQTVFLVEIALSALVILFLVQVPNIERQPVEGEAGETSGYWSELKAGCSYIVTSRMLTVSILLGAVGLFLVFLSDGLLALWAKQIDFAEPDYGLIMSAMGLGSVAGALIAGQFNAWKQHPLRMLGVAAVFLGLFNIVIGIGGYGWLPNALPLWLAIFTLFGVAGAVSAIPFSYILQAETPEHLIGRVSGVSAGLQSGAALSAPLIGAAVANWIGVGGAFAIAGSTMVCCALLVLAFSGRIESTAKNLLAEESSSHPEKGITS